jgi:hypothetical protein
MRTAFFLLAAALQAQQPAGVAPAWDAGKLFADLTAQSNRLQPMLKQIQPKDWISAGAPQSYVTLWQKAMDENQAFAAQAQAVAKTPDKLADSLRLLEAMHAVQESVAELLPGVEKYQNPALAELLAGVQGEGQPARDALSQRVLDLAADREQQFAVADHEAQRCREILSQHPGAVKSK